jgi:tail assembly chaperone E/41/14-like protein
LSEIITIKLHVPIEAHDEELTELKLRRPTADELITHGQPYILVSGGGGGIKADYRACAGLLVAICGIPPSSVAKLDPADFDDLAMVLVGFTKRAPAGGVTGPGSAATK